MKFLKSLFDTSLKKYLYNKELSKKGIEFEVNLSDGTKFSSAGFNLQKETSVGQALTEFLDKREDKSMYLIGYKVLR